MTGAELVIKLLTEHQVESIFGYPGGAIMPIYDALYQSPVKHYLCRHEQGGGFSAIGYARASGQTGVCRYLIEGLAGGPPVAAQAFANAICGHEGGSLFGSAQYSHELLGLQPDADALFKSS